ncbi:hypothetical protein RI049_13100 [Cedecea neteri]|uniref:hypothetical protein n=1 Tax=Cedecea neteri TaxID=158822 RepID=UPI002AA73856|nr:hypothetical protein [Cedecea neteri]WPU21032.1 hypothetical protein RI049_13100 [Cedecea neteri]
MIVRVCFFLFLVFAGFSAAILFIPIFTDNTEPLTWMYFGYLFFCLALVMFTLLMLSLLLFAF